MVSPDGIWLLPPTTKPITASHKKTNDDHTVIRHLGVLQDPEVWPDWWRGTGWVPLLFRVCCCKQYALGSHLLQPLDPTGPGTPLTTVTWMQSGCWCVDTQATFGNEDGRSALSASTDGSTPSPTSRPNSSILCGGGRSTAYYVSRLSILWYEQCATYIRAYIVKWIEIEALHHIRYTYQLLRSLLRKSLTKISFNHSFWQLHT